jgi:hypothetical protein
MPRELVHVDNGRVTWSAAVHRIASMLDPLGSAAEIFSHISACLVEINQFRVEQVRLARQQATVTELIRLRRENVFQVFELEKRLSSAAKILVSNLLDGYQVMVREAVNMRISEDERIIAKTSVVAMSDRIVQFHANGGDTLVRLSDSLRLGDADMAVATLRQLES